MEAVGAAASIIGIIGAGAKISIVLFDLAGSIGSAAAEVRAIGTEISLFCAVLHQLQRILDKPQSRRYSAGALEVTQQILDQCKEVFEDIERILDGLQSRKAATSTHSVDFKARLKWAFSKRSKIQVHRATLESCKITLHLMITTLAFAQTVSSRRVSTAETEIEDEQEELITRSLVSAQQCAIEKLEKLEDEVFSGSASAATLDYSLKESLSLTDYTVLEPHPGERPSQSQLKETGDADFESLRSRRKSIWLRRVLSNDTLDPETRRLSIQSANSRVNKVPELLWKWTDQGAHWNEMHKESSISDSKGQEPSPNSSTLERHTLPLRSPTTILGNGALPSISRPSEQHGKLDTKKLPPEWSGSPKKQRKRAVPSPLNLTASPKTVRTPGPLVSPSPRTATFFTRDNPSSPLPGTYFPKNNLTGPSSASISANPQSPGLDQGTPSSQSQRVPLSLSPNSTTHTSLSKASPINSVPKFDKSKQYRDRVHKDDTCESLITAALSRLHIPGEVQEYALFIVCGEQQRMVDRAEKPLALFKSLEQNGQNPVFMVRRVQRVDVPSEPGQWI